MYTVFSSVMYYMNISLHFSHGHAIYQSWQQLVYIHNLKENLEALNVLAGS